LRRGRDPGASVEVHREFRGAVRGHPAQGRDGGLKEAQLRGPQGFGFLRREQAPSALVPLKRRPQRVFDGVVPGGREREREQFVFVFVFVVAESIVVCVREKGRQKREISFINQQQGEISRCSALAKFEGHFVEFGLRTFSAARRARIHGFVF